MFWLVQISKITYIQNFILPQTVDNLLFGYPSCEHYLFLIYNEG